MSSELDNNKKPSQPGSMIGAGIAIGVGVGVALGVALLGAGELLGPAGYHSVHIGK